MKYLAITLQLRRRQFCRYRENMYPPPPTRYLLFKKKTAKCKFEYSAHALSQVRINDFLQKIKTYSQKYIVYTSGKWSSMSINNNYRQNNFKTA